MKSFNSPMGKLNLIKREDFVGMTSFNSPMGKLNNKL